jgi:hypothetical protein
MAQDLGIVTSAQQWRNALNVLIEESLVVAAGNTRARRYCAHAPFATSD